MSNNVNLLHYWLGNPEVNIIMWMDHRAKVEADTINATHHKVLKYTSSAISNNVNWLGNPEVNIIMWMDHQDKVEADTINATHHEVLKYTGSAISNNVNLLHYWLGNPEVNIIMWMDHRAKLRPTQSLPPTTRSWNTQAVLYLTMLTYFTID